MKNTRTKLFIILYIILISCVEKSKSINQLQTKPVTDTLVEQGQVVINFKSDRKELLDYINIVDYETFYGNQPSIDKDRIDSTHLKIVLNSVTKSKIIEMTVFGTKELYQTRVFISPNDTLNIKLIDGEMSFVGKNKHHGFFKSLDSLTNNWSSLDANKGLNLYKQQSVELYNEKINFYEDFIKKNNTTEEFNSQIKSEIKFEYLYNLVAPRSKKSVDGAYNLNDENGLGNLLGNSFLASEKELVNLEKYFDSIELEYFKQNQHITNDFYKRSLVMYIRHYFTQQEFIDYTRENFESELLFINENLDNNSANYAKGRLITDFFDKGFGLDVKNKKYLKSQIDTFLENDNLPDDYKSEVEKVKEELTILNSKIPDDILEEKLLTYYGDTITFKNLIESSKNKLLISFWGYESKCEPCIFGIQKLNKFDSNYNIDFKYISVQNNSDDWKNGLKSIPHLINEDYHYKILSDNMKSNMLSFFKVRINQTIAIPRYLAVDNNFNILMNNIPRPQDSLVFKNSLKNLYELNFGE